MKNLKTHNGKTVTRDDARKAFSIAKSILKFRGMECKTSLTGSESKNEVVERLIELFFEVSRRLNEDSLDLVKTLSDEIALELLEEEKVYSKKKILLISGVVFCVGLAIGKIL